MTPRKHPSPGKTLELSEPCASVYVLRCAAGPPEICFPCSCKSDTMTLLRHWTLKDPQCCDVWIWGGHTHTNTHTHYNNHVTLIRTDEICCISLRNFTHLDSCSTSVWKLFFSRAQSSSPSCQQQQQFWPITIYFLAVKWTNDKAFSDSERSTPL